MVHNDSKRYKLRVLIVTVSTSRTLDSDVSGVSIEKRFRNEGIATERTICRDDEDAIIGTLLSRNDFDVYVFVGGTGPSRLDVTVESLRKVSRKEISGFGELFRQKSNNQMAYLSNATLLLKGEKQIYCIPGSPDATEVAYPIISSFINHLYTELTKE
jgi:molybdenum cofactor biosynthesis protein B